MGKLWLIIAAFIVSLCQAQYTVLEQVCSSNKQSVSVDALNAQVLIGGLFDIREPGINGIGCGKPNPAMMQVFEAARYAITLMKNEFGINYGMTVYDTCSNPRQAVKGLQSIYPQTTSNNPFCPSNTMVLTGVVGSLSSSTSMKAAELASQLSVGMVSPAAMATDLSNKYRYPTFLRTVPSNTILAKAVTELLIQLRWQNILVVYVNDDNGRNLYEQLLQATYNQGLCVSFSLPLGASVDKDSYKTVLQNSGYSNFGAAVLLASESQSRVIMQAVDEVTSFSSTQWILTGLDITTDPSSLNRVRGALVVLPRSPFIQEFKDYFVGLKSSPLNNTGNPWFKEWYEQTYSCSFAANNCAAPPSLSYYFQSPWVVPTIKSMFAYGSAVRTACSNNRGLCSDLSRISPQDFYSILQKVDYTFPDTFSVSGLRNQRIRFDAFGDSDASEFTVYNFNNRGGSYTFEEIGAYVSSVLTLTKQPVFYDSTRNNVLTSNPTATCQSLGCLNCLLPQRNVTYRYSPGDIVIASLVQAHLPGRTPFTCGDGIIPRLSSLVAIEWALSNYKRINPNKLNGVSLGYMIADVCPDSLVARGFLTDLLSGNNRLTDASGAAIPSDTIRAFIDLTESDTAKSVSPILSSYMIPEVQVGATTPDVRNSLATPYFTRAVPNDEVFYSAVASMLQSLGWKYVQVATYSSGPYNDMTQTFIKVAANYGICVVSTVQLFDSTLTSRYNTMLDMLLGNYESQVVVVIGGQEDVRGLLTALRSRNAVGQLQLVAGTDMWARNPDYVKGLETAAEGSIVLGLEMAADADFNTYIRSLSLTIIQAQPFLRELFEISNLCSLDPSTRGMYSRTCTASDSFNIFQGKTPYIIQSVYTLADKLHELLTELCSSGYSGLCANFRSAANISMLLDAKLQNLAKSNGYGIKNGEGITDYRFFVYKQSAYTQFGQFNTENQMLSSMTASLLGNYQTRISRCSGACLSCDYMFSIQNIQYNTGDWLIAGAFSASDPGPDLLQPYVCGAIRLSNGPQYTAAMLFAIDQVNKKLASVSVPGVKFGSLVMDHCNNPNRTNLLVSGVYSGLMNNIGVDNSKVLAWMTDNTASTDEAEKILNPLGVAIVSPSATSAKLKSYPNFFRTVQGDQTIALALVKIIKALGFPYIQLVYGANDYGRGGRDTLTAVTQAEGICITNSQELSSTNTAGQVIASLLAQRTDVVVLFLGSSDTDTFLTAVAADSNARSRLVILMPEPYTKIVQKISSSITRPIISLKMQKKNTLSKYNAYINSSPISNPYFAKYYMKVMNCNLPGYSTYTSPCPMPLKPITNSASYEEDNYVLSTINSVYAIVNALDLTIRDYCGQNYVTPCYVYYASSNKLDRFNQRLNDVSFVDEGQNSFRFLDREGNTAYDILQWRNGAVAYTSIGSYAGSSLDLMDSSLSFYSTVVSQCAGSCITCNIRALNYSYTTGDIYLGGMFDVHDRSLSPFTCGGINKIHGFLLLEAFHYALDKVNSKKGQFADILKNVKLGGVGLDACGSQVRGGYLVSNINNGLTTLTRDGITIPPSLIDAYIGSYDSTASIYLAKILTDLKIPQISYASGSEDLSDKRVFPYFFRTVPSDGNQVSAMLSLLDQLDIRYVQILYEDNSNGNTARDAFIAQAASKKICVAQTVSYQNIGIVSPQVANSIVSKLIEIPAANTVITFIGAEYVNALLAAITRSPRAQNKFRFIGSVAWADNQEAISGAEKAAVGSITLKLDADDIEDFENYMNSKTLSNSNYNPWFEEYYQKIQNCYTSKANPMGYPRACSLTPASIITSPGYQQDPGVVFVINAVYSAAFALHETLKLKCGKLFTKTEIYFPQGVSYSSVCQAYKGSSDRRTQLATKLEGVRFTDPAGNLFNFVNRSGVSNYRYLSIDRGLLDGVVYNQIGSFNGTVNISSSYSSSWDSTCNRREACAECPGIRNSDVRYLFHPNANLSSTAPVIIGFFDIHQQGVDPYRCGDLNVQGYQQFLAFYYTIQQVISQSDRNKLRVLAIDTCSNNIRVDQDLYGLLEGAGLCNSIFDPSSGITLDKIASVITLGELNTAAASRVLENPKVTYLSPNALSSLLDDKQYLLRTIAPNSAMMRTLASLFSKLEWKYVDAVFESDRAEGIYAWEEFDYYAGKNDLCVGEPLALDDKLTAANIQLNGDKGSKVVILFGTTDFVRQVMSLSTSLIDQYIWVLGVEWDVTPDSLKGIIPPGKTVKLVTTRRKSYLVESFQNFAKTNLPTLKWYNECTNKPDCSKAVANGTNNYVLNTILATYAAAAGFRAQPAGQGINRATLRQSTLDVTLNLNAVPIAGDLKLANLTNDLPFDFEKLTRWWNSGFEIRILSATADQSSVVTIKELKKFLVATDLTDSQLSEAKSALNITSVCTSKTGCVCAAAAEVSKTSSLTNTMTFAPSRPRNYYAYHDNGDLMYEWPVWAIVVAILTSLGLLITLILFIFLLAAYQNKGGTSILGYMVIVGILGIYVINFAFFVNANEGTCGSRRFLMGVVYMIAFAPMLLKAIDNWRFSQVDDDKERYSGISSACALFMTSIGIVLVQCIIPIIWLILVHPTASNLPMGNTRHDNWWCDPPADYDTGIVLSMVFVMFIVFVTAIFSAITFDSDRNNFESRWILFGSVATAGCFVVWMIVSTSAEPPYRDAAVTIGNLVNATLLVIAMPLRKSVLLCRALTNKEKDDQTSEVLDYGHNMGYSNENYQLDDYDNYKEKRI
ncbi:uncharacterized protein LOC131936264 [Physella acuta]|uniref:uncharacterized protein LOC131936264 n=1 Tax=Physella acuta TaxID=109671 RepID=UPI0027DCB5B6|nr:uncharacterized protein LOC131936264 [Physella acuta]